MNDGHLVRPLGGLNVYFKGFISTKIYMGRLIQKSYIIDKNGYVDQSILRWRYDPESAIRKYDFPKITLR